MSLHTSWSVQILTLLRLQVLCPVLPSGPWTHISGRARKDELSADKWLCLQLAVCPPEIGSRGAQNLGSSGSCERDRLSLLFHLGCYKHVTILWIIRISISHKIGQIRERIYIMYEYVLCLWNSSSSKKKKKTLWSEKIKLCSHKLPFHGWVCGPLALDTCQPAVSTPHCRDVLGIVTQPGSGGLQTSGKPKLRMFYDLKCLSFGEELEEPGPSSNPHGNLPFCP